MKYIALKDFTIGEADIDMSLYNEIERFEEVIFVEKDDPEVKSGFIFDTNDLGIDFEEIDEDELQEGIKLINFMINNGYIISYKDYREQQINAILND